MRDQIASFLFGALALALFAAAVLHDDSEHMSRDPHHLSE